MEHLCANVGIQVLQGSYRGGLHTQLLHKCSKEKATIHPIVGLLKVYERGKQGPPINGCSLGCSLEDHHIVLGAVPLAEASLAHRASSTCVPQQPLLHTLAKPAT